MSERFNKVKIIACSHKGKRCTAIAKNKKKWIHDAQSESEAELLIEAVVDRGWVPEEYWREA